MINGKPIHLNPLEIEDADFLLHWNNDSDYTGEFEPFEPVSRVEHEAWLLSDSLDQLWCIIENALGERVGQIAGRYQRDCSIQIGYRVIPLAQGRGYCSGAYFPDP